MQITKIILITAFFFLSACSKKDNQNAKYEVNYKSGTCDHSVSLDFNHLVIFCYYVWDPKKEDYVNCKKIAENFISQYPGIDCKAQYQKAFSNQYEEVVVTEKDIQALIDKLTKMGY